MSTELQALKQELRQKGSHNREQDEELISAMREQVQSISAVQIGHFVSLEDDINPDIALLVTDLVKI